ncbi:MAG: amino acid ABC transporter substrate-binding protein, partial [Ignavibacteriae bacterium]|nr:amino acid ABC transporter substrate-binding protein [Ignavibacteriota bacterium]
MSSFFGKSSYIYFSVIIRLRLIVCIAVLGVITPFSSVVFAQANQNISTLQSIKERGYFTWGADAEGGAPYVFVNPDNPNELIGYEVDIANEIASRLGVKAVMKQNAWDALVPALTRKDFDIILNGLEITPPRLEEISFTKPYYVYSEQMVVRAEENRIGTFFDLREKTVGTLSASVGMTMLQELGGVNIKVYPGVVEPYHDLADKRL